MPNSSFFTNSARSSDSFATAARSSEMLALRLLNRVMATSARMLRIVPPNTRQNMLMPPSSAAFGLSADSPARRAVAITGVSSPRSKTSVSSAWERRELTAGSFPSG